MASALVISRFLGCRACSQARSAPFGSDGLENHAFLLGTCNRPNAGVQRQGSVAAEAVSWSDVLWLRIDERLDMPVTSRQEKRQIQALGNSQATVGRLQIG